MSDDAGIETVDDEFIGDESYCPMCGASFAPLIDRCPDDGTRLIRWRSKRESVAGMILDGRFRIVEQIGQGAMGLVYRGVQLSIDRPVAIKVIRKHLSHDRMTAKRFLREARMLTTFNHPNIVNMLELGQTGDGELYLVMELARGRTLDAELAETGRFDVRRTCELAMQLCDALAAAHAHGIVHRDLKPANIMVSTTHVGRDLVKVLDFGVAKPLHSGRRATTTNLTEAGMVMGTPAYIAPEAVSGDGIDTRSDLYALGCIMYELLAGTVPFPDSAVHVVVARHLSEAPPPLPRDVPPQLAQLVYALLEKSPEQRPDSAAHVHAELRAFLRGSVGPAARRELEEALQSLHDESPTVPRRQTGEQAMSRVPTSPVLETTRRRASVPPAVIIAAVAVWLVVLLIAVLR